MAEGKSNRGIAEELVVTEAAVEKHVTGIFHKLDLGADADRPPARARGPDLPAQLGELSRERDRRRHDRAAAERTLDAEPATQHGEPVRKPRRPVPSGRAPPTPLSFTRRRSSPVLDLDRHLGVRCARVFREFVSASDTTK